MFTKNKQKKKHEKERFRTHSHHAVLEVSGHLPLNRPLQVVLADLPVLVKDNYYTEK